MRQVLSGQNPSGVVQNPRAIGKINRKGRGFTLKFGLSPRRFEEVANCSASEQIGRNAVEGHAADLTELSVRSQGFAHLGCKAVHSGEAEERAGSGTRVPRTGQPFV